VIEVTQLAQKLLSGVYRTGQRFGLGYVANVLTGAADELIEKRGHDTLSVHGIVSAEEAALLRPLARALQARGCLEATEHGGLQLSGDARAILKGEMAMVMAQPPARTKSSRRDRSSAPNRAPNPSGDPLFEALRGLRRDLAAEAKVPPYVIFNDATLRQMAADRPQNMDAMAGISGVGARKLDAYGEAFLRVIREYG
jgi:ATP-dependent DNA helicase RecQ